MGLPLGQTLGEGLGAGSTPGARAKKRKASPPDTVPSKKPPPKPNLDSRRVKAVASATFVTKGKPTSLMQPQPLAEVHPFMPTLKGWQHGINMDCGPDWDWEVIEAAVARGPHPIATTPDAIAFFKEDMAYQEKGGFLTGNAMGRPATAPSDQLKNLASSSGATDKLLRPHHSGPIIPSLPGGGRSIHGNPGECQRHDGDKFPIHPCQGDWQGPPPHVAVYERCPCRATYPVLQVGHQRWFLVAECT